MKSFITLPTLATFLLANLTPALASAANPITTTVYYIPTFQAGPTKTIYDSTTTLTAAIDCGTADAVAWLPRRWGHGPPARKVTATLELPVSTTTLVVCAAQSTAAAAAPSSSVVAASTTPAAAPAQTTVAGSKKRSF